MSCLDKIMIDWFLNYLLVDWSVVFSWFGLLVGRSVGLSLVPTQAGRLHFHAPIGALLRLSFQQWSIYVCIYIRSNSLCIKQLSFLSGKNFLLIGSFGWTTTHSLTRSGSRGGLEIIKLRLVEEKLLCGGLRQILLVWQEQSWGGNL